jgi:predicted secreted protein
VTLPTGKTLTVTLTPNATSDYDLELYNSAGTKLTSSTKGTGLADTVTSTAAGVLYAKVIRYSGGTGATSGKYTLSASW